MGRWIPSDIWWDFIKENQLRLCLWYQHTWQANTHIPTHGNISSGEISSCLFALKRKWRGIKVRSQAHEELLCGLWCLCWALPAIPALLFPPQKMWLDVKALSRAFIHIVYILLRMASAAFSLLLSAFIRKMWLLFSVCVLIPFIQWNENALVG